MKVLVTGATSMVGDFLLPRLVAEGHQVVAVSRRSMADSASLHWLCADMGRSGWARRVGPVDAWINLAPLGTLSATLEETLEQVRPARMVAFSSTSRFTKRFATGESDRRFAAELIEGEAQLQRACQARGVHWNVLRPTLIYHLGRDKNLTQIRRFLCRFHFFPLVGGGRALRQPVHAEDLAIACLQLLACSTCVDRAYNLSGAEVLSYRAMVERLFAREGLSPRFLEVPVLALRSLLWLLRQLPAYRYLTLDMADRMAVDMVFSHQEAARDFGFAPRPFEP